ncbi:DEAD/DEAH box helicase [Chitinophaga lutea]
MSVFGIFIGVNKYEDHSIRDLAGSRNDAIALGTLFEDTLRIACQIITDEEAILSNISGALDHLLSAASDSDTVILYYSGHGSQDHRLTAYDTELSNLDSTTISMEAIAKFFSHSKAKNILCILDCCFAGGAPAKVLENSPISRSMGNPLETLAGTGRIILAASNYDQPSYELPSTGHGILTKAVIDVLQLGSADTINILTAIDEILRIVRTEASRIGVEQTPVLLNYITGGLVIPKLVPGEKYFSFFPKRRGTKISKDISEVSQFGLNQKLIQEWRNLYPGGLNDLQLEAVNEFRILEGESILVIAPTSSGKTFVGEMAGAKGISQGKKAVFLFPYKALVNEKFDQFTDLYQSKLGFRVIRCTGDYLDQNNEFVKGKYDIALLTYEMFLNLSISIPETLGQIGLVVLDEAQFITDPTRGISVELLLTNLISARSRGIKPQLVVLSAVIGDSNNFEEWLGCRKLLTIQRPIPLVEGVLNRRGEFKFLAEDGTTKIEQFVPSHEIVQRKTKPGQQDVIVPLVKKLVAQGEKVIVFRNQKGPAEGCANYLATDLGLEPASQELLMLPKHSSSTTSSKLKACFQGGTAFHNSNLSRDERRVVERAFRDSDSKIRVLGATTTVAAGINTPASTVILAEQEFIGDDGRPFSIAEYKNMAGRAGRVGFNEEGKSIILADAEHNPEYLFNRYVLGQPEPLISSFKIESLDTWIVKLLAQVKDVKKDDLINLLTNTYGGFLANKTNPDWYKNMGFHVAELYEEMKRLGIVEEENNIVHLTILGRACAESVLSFRSALRLVDLLKSRPKSFISAVDLMAIVQALPESDDIYTPMFKKGQSEAKWPNEISRRYSIEISQLLQKFVSGDAFKYYARCKRASILFDWIKGDPTETIEERYRSNNPFSGNITYGNIKTFADFTRFQLRSAYKIATVIFPGQIIDDQEFDSLLRCLEAGIPADCIDLLTLPFQMSREEHLALYRNGIKTKDQLYVKTQEDLLALLEQATVETIFSKNN